MNQKLCFPNSQPATSLEMRPDIGISARKLKGTIQYGTSFTNHLKKSYHYLLPTKSCFCAATSWCWLTKPKTTAEAFILLFRLAAEMLSTEMWCHFPVPAPEVNRTQHSSSSCLIRTKENPQQLSGVMLGCLSVGPQSDFYFNQTLNWTGLLISCT